MARYEDAAAPTIVGDPEKRATLPPHARGPPNFYHVLIWWGIPNIVSSSTVAQMPALVSATCLYLLLDLQLHKQHLFLT